MVSAKSLLFAALAAVVSAAPTCTKPTLPQVGGGATELTAPPASLTLKKIAVGHGIQNYTCANANASAVATGAVAVLYDATTLFPGTEKSGLPQGVWDKLPAAALFGTPLPLNKLAGSRFGADAAKPFPAPTADLRLPFLPAVKFLGYHYFDSTGTPMFDLVAARLRASVVKKAGVNAPSQASKGVLDTGAVQWLQLGDSGKGLSEGLSTVYRVLTAGGVAQKCSAAGAGVQSVPYAAFYWFYG